MSWGALRDRAREFFTLEEMERASHALPEEKRATVSRALEFTAQRREAAETLWPRGSTAEALGLLYASLDDLSSALSDLASETAAASLPWLSSSLAVVAGAQKQVEGMARPELDADVQPGHEAAFPAMVDALLSVQEAVGRCVVAPGQVGALRWTRRFAGVLGVAGTVIGVGATVAYALYTPMFSHAVASAAFNTEHVADHAIDGDTKTWWVLPSKDPAWIDLTLGKPQPVPRLRILGHNPPWNDRLTKDAHIEAFLNGTLVKAADVTFRIPPSTEPDWTDVNFGAPKCDRIRITVQSAARGTGSIGEVQLL